MPCRLAVANIRATWPLDGLAINTKKNLDVGMFEVKSFIQAKSREAILIRMSTLDTQTEPKPLLENRRLIG